MSFPTLTEMIGYVAASLTTAAFLPQAIHTFRTRDLEGISLAMYVALNLGVLLWLVYGFINGDGPLVVANAITLLLAGSILVMKVRAGSRGTRSAPG